MSNNQVFHVVALALICLMVCASCAAEIGTRENPVPMGNSVNLSDGWQITVVKVVPNATDIILRENIFNQRPKPECQFFLATVEVTYIGPDSSSFNGPLRLRAVGPSSVGYSTFENSPGVIPNQLPYSEAYTGGVISGNIGWEIKSSDANALVMYDEPMSFGSKGNRAFMALYQKMGAAPNDQAANNTTVWTNEGTTLGKLGKYDEAIKAYDEAIRIDPNYVDAWQGKGVVLVFQNKTNEAIEAFDKVPKINPKNEDVLKAKDSLLTLKNIDLINECINWTNRGGSLFNEGKYDEAINAFNKSIDLAGTFPQTQAVNQSLKQDWLYKGAAFALQNKTIEAIKAFDEAIKLDPNYAKAWQGKGLALKALNRNSEADAAFVKAKEFGYKG